MSDFTAHHPASTPPPPAGGEVTAILSRSSTDPAAAAALLPLVYAELRSLARSRLARAGGANNTFEPTALVHEAYVRLVGPGGEGEPNWQGRGHFFAAAALAMRNILVDQARRKAAIKHGGDRDRVEINAEVMAIAEPKEDIIALDAALSKLQQIDERKARVVMLRYFSGLTADETALAMGLSVPTVHREWKLAKALLKLELAG